MSTPGVPPWGVPWHGQVRGGRIYLDNGTSRTYRQPEATSYQNVAGQTFRPADTYGITHRHAAGLPPVERSAEELAADFAAGREWRNEATLSGGRLQLHSKLTNGWIYIDPDGARWLVRCVQLQNEPAVSLTSPLPVVVSLTRFGVLGGVPESYSYSLDLVFSDTGGNTSGSLLLDAISPTGNAAVVMAFRRITNNRFLQRDPLCFLELTINGPGASAVVASTQVLGFSETQTISAPLPYVQQWLDENRVWHTVEPASTFAVSFIKCTASGQRDFSSIVAQWYDSSGQRVDVKWRARINFVISAPLPDVPAYPADFPDYVTSSSYSGDVQLVVGDQVVSSISITASLALTFIPGGSGYTSGVLGSTYSTGMDGVSFSGSYTETRNFDLDAPFPNTAMVGSYSGIFASSSAPTVSMGGLNPAVTWRVRLGLYWYSRQMPGFEFSYENGNGNQPSTRVWRNLPPATPSGQASGATQQRTIANPPIYYGSHDPYSGAAVWYEPSPVCYV